MIDAAVQDEAGDNSSDSTKDELSELRGLLLAPELTQLTNLQERLDDPARYAEDVSRILPDAVTLRSNRDNKLTNALMPTVEETIGISVRKNPQRLVDAIFPVMGPAIRKAIANAFSEMVQSLNQTLDYSISLKGLKWRFEALRTGKSFAEVVMSHTMLYRVEQVFLIHRETGLLLQHVEAGDVGVQDADLVSGMLTAIQDFVHDSFGTDGTDSLDSMQVGEFTVWIDRNAKAVLALVIRGSAPLELRGVMQDALDSIYIQQHEALEAFDGDAAPFVASRAYLESCIRKQTGAASAKRPSAVVLVVVGLILLAISLWLFFSIRDNRRWHDYLSRLGSEPGLMVVSAEKRGGKYYITGLRDSLAVDPSSLLSASSIDPEQVSARWEPYQSSYPDFVLTRANRVLDPPDTVTLSIAEGALVARGFATHDWIKTARRVAQTMPGLARLDEQDLIDIDNVRNDLQAVTNSLEQHSILFRVGSAEIDPEEREQLKIVMSDIQRLAKLSKPLGEVFRVSVEGHADQTGPQELNDRLIPARAAQVMSTLMEMGAKPHEVEIADPTASKKAREYNRTVTFRVNKIATQER